MSTELMTLLSVVEGLLLVVVLAIALFQVQRRLNIISRGLKDLAEMLIIVESGHLQPLAKLVADVNDPLNIIAKTLPGIAAKAALVVRKAQEEG